MRNESRDTPNDFCFPFAFSVGLPIPCQLARSRPIPTVTTTLRTNRSAPRSRNIRLCGLGRQVKERAWHPTTTTPSPLTKRNFASLVRVLTISS